MVLFSGLEPEISVINYIKIIFLIIFSTIIYSCEQKEYVKDFKVEGIAVGDSLLTYFSKEHILEFQRKNDVKGNPIDLSNKIYIDSVFDRFKFETYESLQVYYRIDDNDFKILSIGGLIWYGTDSKSCMNKLFEVRDLLKDQYKTPKIEEELDTPSYDVEMGDSRYNKISFVFDNGEMIMISCNDYDNELLDIQDYFDLQIYSAELTKFLGYIE